MPNSFNDPYLYLGTDILINKYDLKNKKLLDILEAAAFQKRLSEGIPSGNFDYTHLKSLHFHLFQDLYHWAGQERTISISKGESRFASPSQISPYLNKLFLELACDNYLSGMDFQTFCQKVGYYFGEMNAVHPFREGNGRTQRIFIDKLAEKSGYQLFWEKVTRNEYIDASIQSFYGDVSGIVHIFSSITEPISFEPSIKIINNIEVKNSEEIDKTVFDELLIKYIEKS